MPSGSRPSRRTLLLTLTRTLTPNSNPNPNPNPDPNPNLNPNPNPNPNLNPNHLKACFDSRKAECGAAHKELVFIGSRQPPPQAVRSRL